MTTSTTRKPWEMSQAEYSEWYTDTFGESDGVPYAQRVSKWKQDGKISLVLGKPVNNNIERENGHDESGQSISERGRENDLHAGAIGRESNHIPERVPTERIPENEPDRTRAIRDTESGDDDPGREQSYGNRGAGLHRVESGNPVSDTGKRDRLVPSDKDIVLTVLSDIGHDAGAGAKFDANVLAIKTLKTIESENRQATKEEQEILSKYSGFGDSAFSEAFPRYKDRAFGNTAWGRRRAELEAITTEAELKSIEGSRLNAFYTTPEVIRHMWKAVDEMGAGKLNNPRVLEPSAGSGRFLGYEPPEIAAKSQRIAVELDSLTGRMLKQMYPQTETYITGFEKAPIPKDSIDVAISNVPFGNYQIFDPTFKKDRKKLTHSIHNYFFAKTLEELRPGGILAFITSHMTMDAPTAKPVRQYLADQADLVGAIRLPNNAFPDTQVVTDIIFMRKRSDGETPGDQSWVDTTEQDYPVHSRYGDDFTAKLDVNNYFVKHPEMVLGKPSGNGSMNPRNYNEGEYTVEPKGDLVPQLDAAINHLPKNIITEAPRRELTRRVYGSEAAIGGREGSQVIGEDGNVYIKRGGGLESANLIAVEETKVKQMMAIRDAAKAVVDIQVRNGTDAELKSRQDTLNDLYRKYVLDNGPLTAPDNADLMDKDPDMPFLKALESDAVFKKAQKDLTDEDRRLMKVLKGTKPLVESDIPRIQMPVFRQRIIHGLGEVPVNDYADAESVVKNETGRMDFRLMAEKLGKTEDEVITALAERKLIYKNPKTGEWEAAEQYLTGDVRQKLKDAAIAATARPREFSGNVDALKVVQPKDISAGEIGVRMGAPWIPEEDINDFVGELLEARNNYYRREKNQYYHLNEVTGEWVCENNPPAGSYMLKETYGTQRKSATQLITAILNGKLVEVMDKLTDENGVERSVRNNEETIAAQEKANLIQKKFQEWIWKDDARTKRLVESYNDKFNNFRPRTFDGSHLSLPGIAEKWNKQMHSHQRDAIWRVVQDRTALLAHEVGFGKTAVMVSSGMELRRMGLSRKNLYVVPKATHAQFRDQFQDVYPFAKILFPAESDFTAENRAEFMSRAVTGDWDAIIVADSQFKKMPIRPETEERFLNEEIENIREALETVEDKKTQKEIQKVLKNAQVKMLEIQQRIKDKSDNTIYFEDLGVDQMYVDEADNFKNLRFVTRMGRIKGLPNSNSDRAWDMYQKTRVLQEEGHTGVVFATGTPVANTIAEMYTNMRYLQEPMLEEKGLKHFDAWAKTFGETTESLEQTPTGAYKMTQRFAKFGNAPELSNMWQMVADIRVADEVPAMVAQRPRIVNEKGQAKRTVIATPPDQQLLDYMGKLAERADNLRNVSPKDDNMLKISSDARKASLDMRLVEAGATVNPNGKVAVASKKIAEIYRDTTKDKGTQLVFLDLGTPKAKENEVIAEPAIDSETGLPVVDEEEDTVEEQSLLKDVYNSMKAQLIADGIAEKDIAFIHDAKNNKQKIALMDKVNKGEIRVLVGSTGKLGVGVNVQERVAALHHLDAPWRPRDIEQREGRVIRQGNIVYGPRKDENGKILDAGPGVHIYSYVTERSFDAYMWQAIEAKSKAIKSIMRRAVPPRVIEDIDSFTMSASEAKAVASGNPDVFKSVSLKNSVTRMQMLKSSYVNDKIRANSNLQSIPPQIAALKENIGKIEKDIPKVKPDAKFAIKIKGELYHDRADVGETLREAIRKAENQEEIAEYSGFKVKVLDQGPQSGYVLVLTSPETGFEYKTTSILYRELTDAGSVTRVENVVKSIPKVLEHTREELREKEKTLKTYAEMAEKPFEYEDRLTKMEAELDRLSRKLQGQEVEETPSDNYIPDDGEPEGNEPEYHFNQRTEKTLEHNAEKEIEAVTAEVSPVETETEVKAEPAIKVEAIVNKIEPVVENRLSTMAQEAIKTAEPTQNTHDNEAKMPVKGSIAEMGKNREKAFEEKYAWTMPPAVGVDMPLDTTFTAHQQLSWRKGDDSWKSVPAKKIVLPGYEDYDFYLHKDLDKGDHYVVSEGKTGMSMGALTIRADDAITQTAKTLQRVGKTQLDAAIKRGIENHGISPAYRTPKPHKEPHEMTVTEFEESRKNTPFPLDAMETKTLHNEIMKDAIAQGKTIPLHVLKEYQDDLAHDAELAKPQEPEQKPAEIEFKRTPMRSIDAGKVENVIGIPEDIQFTRREVKPTIDTSDIKVKTVRPPESKYEQPAPPDKEPHQMTRDEFNMHYPKLADLPENIQRTLHAKVNAENKEYTTEEGVDFDTFKKDFAYIRFNTADTSVVTDDHRDFVRRAISDNLEVPENVRGEYRDMIAEIEKKRVQSEAARIKKNATRADEETAKSETKTLSMNKLRKMCTETGMRADGNKAELTERLTNAGYMTAENYQKAVENYKKINSELETQSTKAHDLATHMLRHYVQRGETFEQLKRSMMGEGNPDYDISIGGYHNGKKLHPDDVIVTLKKDGQEDNTHIYKLKRLMDEIKAEPSNAVKPAPISEPIGKLTTAERNALPDSEFAEPEKRKYPIEDINHARNALARVSQFGTKKEKAEVRNAVNKKYPELAQGGQTESRGSHKALKADPTPAPATNSKDEQLSFEQLQQRQDERSMRSQVMDNTRQNATVLKPNDPRTKTWYKHPGAMDVKGIDTPRAEIRTEGGKFVRENGKLRFKPNKPTSLIVLKRSSNIPKPKSAGKSRSNQIAISKDILVQRSKAGNTMISHKRMKGTKVIGRHGKIIK